MTTNTKSAQERTASIDLAQLDKLLSALKPFADAYAPEAERVAKFYTSVDLEKYGRAFDGNTITPAVTMGDFRRAFEAHALARRSLTSPSISSSVESLSRASGEERFLTSGAPAEPVDMILHCPKCGKQHVDTPEHAGVNHDDGSASIWDNPPHRSHLCHGCGHIWRPADVPTNGVKAIATKGANDSPVHDTATPSVELVDLLKAIRPNYGAVGSRDVDVTAQRSRIDRAIELLLADAAAPSTDKFNPCTSNDLVLKNSGNLNINEAGAAAKTEQAPASELQAVLDFLMGVSPLEGVHFGGKHPTKAGAYWWRLNLRAVLYPADKG